ncbi:MAG: recombination regulator RecX [Gemmatimonadetes bacterium]|nr:recombination regulator RecX [Gemmatimonadota bacterium]
MPKITALKRSPRRERVRIYVDGGDAPAAELALDLVLRAGLAPGDPLDHATLEPLLREDEALRAREAALALLSHRARSRVEMRRRLAGRDFPGGVIDRTIEWLEERGYLDDDAFADAFVRDRLRLRPRGRIGLLTELRRKGVDEGTAVASVDRVLETEGVDEVALAVEAAEAWAGKNVTTVRAAGRSREDRQRARRRLYGHLARRGFGPDAVRAGVDRALGD